MKRVLGGLSCDVDPYDIMYLSPPEPVLKVDVTTLQVRMSHYEGGKGRFCVNPKTNNVYFHVTALCLAILDKVF